MDPISRAIATSTSEKEYMNLESHVEASSRALFYDHMSTSPFL